MKLTLYFWLTLICYSSAETTIFAFDSSITLPSSSTPLQLESSIVLSCGIEPPLYVRSTYWITPQGSVVDETTNDSHYFFTEGQIFKKDRRVYSTILQITGLSYADSGNYSCVVDTETEPNTRLEATVELRLESNLTTEQQAVTFNAGVNRVNLTCEMSLYTRPDEKLLWIGSNGSVIKQSEKYTITFVQGSQYIAQNGGNQRSPSRLSILTIHSPTQCDSETYRCTLVDSPESQSINLTLQATQSEEDLICNSAMTTTTTTAFISRTQVHGLSLYLLLCVPLLHFLAD